MANSRGPKLKEKESVASGTAKRWVDLLPKPLMALVPVVNPTSATNRSGESHNGTRPGVVNRAVLEKKSRVPTELNLDKTRTHIATHVVVKTPVELRERTQLHLKAIPEDRTKIVLGLGVAVAMAVMTVFFLGFPQLVSKSAGSGQATIDRQALNDRVEFHRKTTGWKLNRERVKAEYENELTAPPLPDGTKKVAAPDMMQGLPLRGEPAATVPPLKQTADLNPNYPDAKVMYMLQDEQDANQWEQAAQDEYLEDLKANAAAKGYEVHIDNEGNVKFERNAKLKAHRPASVSNQ